MKSKSGKLIQNRRILFVLTTCLFSSVLCSAPSVQESIIQYFRVLLKTPQEKVYLQLDKSLYSAGESIWFKGYLVSAVTHREQDAFSKFVMVELVDRKDSIVLSKKIKEEGGLFYGNLTLNGEFPAGDYYLRAYTNWMRNEAPEFFYSRLLTIRNPVDTEVSTEAEYTSVGTHKVQARIHFKADGASLNRRVKVNYAVRVGENTIHQGSSTTDQQGMLQLEVPFDSNSKNQHIDLIFDDNKLEYKTTLYPYLTETDYSVTFFPEGGDLLPVSNQVVAFKAQASNGYSLPVTGRIVNQSGEEVAALSTMVDGMGAFNLGASKGDRFHAEVTSEDGLTKRFDLPPVKDAGIKLAANRTSQGIAYQLLKDEETAWPDTMYVIAHVRGLLRYMQLVGEQRSNDVISDEYLTDGITHLLLLNKEGKTLSERLVFVKKAQQPFLAFTADKPSYGNRERVQLDLTVADVDGTPLSGDFGMSVTNIHLVPYDSLGENILSNLLLTSDLKGFVENPGRYFLGSNRRASAELNLLMLTHGWRRFQLEDLTQTPDTSFQYFVEQGFSITGRVRPLQGSPAGMSVVAMASSIGMLYTATTDENGFFVIQGAEVPDSTEFLVRSRSRNRLPVTVLVDPENQAKPSNPKIPYPDGKVQEELTEEALNAARDRYFAEGGMLLRNLKEVTVTGKKEKANVSDPNHMYIRMADRTFDERFLEDLRELTAWDILERTPGVTLTDNRYFAFQSTPNNTPLLIIDGITYSDPDDHQMLQNYSGHEIESISIIRHNQAALAMLGMNGSNGAFVISTRKVDPLTTDPKANVVQFTPRGYNQSVEFYSPVYSTPTLKARETPDFRSTIHWNPRIQVDETGTARVEYYTDDRNSDQRVVIEGITTDGRALRLEKVIRVNP